MPVMALPARALCCPAGKMAALAQARAKNLLAGLAHRWPPEQPRAWVWANTRQAQTHAVLASDYVCVPQTVLCHWSSKSRWRGRVLKWLPCSKRRHKSAPVCSPAGQQRSVVVGAGPNWTQCCLGSTADDPSAGPATAVLPPPPPPLVFLF